MSAHPTLLAAPRWVSLTFLLGPLGAMGLQIAAPSAFNRFHAESVAGTLILMVLIAPLIEELAFRETIQSRLLGRFKALHGGGIGPITWPNLVTSVMFAAFHAFGRPITLAWWILIPSLYLGWLRIRTNSILPCIAAHAWFNICFLVIWAYQHKL